MYQLASTTHSFVFHYCWADPVLAPAASLAAQQTGGESAAGVLSSLLLLPDDFQPVMRAKHHNSCVHKAMDNQEVKVRPANACCDWVFAVHNVCSGLQ
jgi:hypothetical protein